ncbi:MAG: hypothetical protein ABIJ27_02955 [Candidatus Omnitrophota bacterium]
MSILRSLRTGFACAGLAAVIAVTATGCGPSYTVDNIEESIVDICKREYNLDVKVETIGKTIAIYLPLKNLIDLTFAVTDESSKKINEVLLSATRVVISTDAEFNFYCVIAHDERLPEIQIVIVKSVEDVKRFLLSDISRGDYSKRMLVDLRVNPQAKKEKVIKNVLDKMKLEDDWQEELMDDFFRAEPAAIGEIGYWNDRFFIKDISPNEFIAEQIASRVKVEFRDDPELSKNLMLKSVEGEYATQEKARFFKVDILAIAKEFKDVDKDFSDLVFDRALKIGAHVIHAYKYMDFDYFEIISLKERKRLAVPRDDIELFRKRKITLEELLIGGSHRTGVLY